MKNIYAIYHPRNFANEYTVYKIAAKHAGDFFEEIWDEIKRNDYCGTVKRISADEARKAIANKTINRYELSAISFDDKTYGENSEKFPEQWDKIKNGEKMTLSSDDNGYHYETTGEYITTEFTETVRAELLIIDYMYGEEHIQRTAATTI